MKCTGNSYFTNVYNSSLLWHGATADFEESRVKTANHHVRRKRLSGLCSKVSEFQMTSCRLCDMLKELYWHGFLAQRRLFAEGPFSDQHQTATMIFRLSSMDRLHFHSAAQATYQDVHVKGLLTHHWFVIWGREPRLRSLWAINSLCKFFCALPHPQRRNGASNSQQKVHSVKRALFSVFAPTQHCKADGETLLQPIPQTMIDKYQKIRICHQAELHIAKTRWSKAWQVMHNAKTGQSKALVMQCGPHNCNVRKQRHMFQDKFWKAVSRFFFGTMPSSMTELLDRSSNMTPIPTTLLREYFQDSTTCARSCLLIELAAKRSFCVQNPSTTNSHKQPSAVMRRLVEWMRRHNDRMLRLWSPRFLGQGVRWAPCLGGARPGWHQRHGQPGRLQGEHRVEMASPAEHPNFGRLAEFGESHEVAEPLPGRNTGLRRYSGSVQCQGFAGTPPLKDTGLRRFGGSEQCDGVVVTRFVRDKGLRRCGGFEKCQGFVVTPAFKDRGLRRFGGAVQQACAKPVSVRDKGLWRCCGSQKCHKVAETRPVKDKGLRRYCGSETCQPFGLPGPVRDKGSWRFGFACKSHKCRGCAAIQHQRLRRFLRDFGMAHDQILGPFGHRGHESSTSNRILQEPIQTSQDFGLGADQDSHCGWILGKLWVLQFCDAWVQLPLSCLDDLEHNWNPVEHHGWEAAQTLLWMQRTANLQSCGVQLDRADAKPRHWDRLLGRGARQWNRRLATEQSPAVVGSIFQQCQQSRCFTRQL